MSRPCVPAACSPSITKVAGGCTTCGAETQICCLKVTHSEWARPRFLRATSYAIGDPCTDATKTNWCGEWYTPNFFPGVDCNVVKDCCMPWVRIAVETRTNCDLYMQVEYLDAVNDGHVSFIVQPASTWHSSPYTATIPGTTETLTIEVCEETDVIFPEENDPVALRAALWFLVDGVWSPYIAGSSETPPPNQVYAAATGNSMCILAGCSDTNPDRIVGYLEWEYDIRTDEVIVRAGSTVAYGEVRVPWDSAGAWADTLTVPVDAPFILEWATDAEWRVAKITDCDDPTDPGVVCDVENACWPDLCPCLVDGETGEIYRTIYADVSGEHTETELPLMPGGGLGGDRYQWTRGGSDAITILCMNGGLDPYMVSVSLGPDSYFCTIPAGGLQCNGGQLVPYTFACGDIEITLYTL